MEEALKEIVLEASLRGGGKSAQTWYGMFYSFLDTLSIEYNRPCGFFVN